MNGGSDNRDNDRENTDNGDNESYGSGAETETEGLSNKAKVVKAMMKNKSVPERTEAPLVKGSRWGNFWYHYKLHTIFILFIGTFLIISIAQLVTRETPDAVILYAGPKYINEDRNTAIRNAVKQVMSEDFNGDGYMGVMLTDITYMNEAQIRASYTEAQEDGVNVTIDGSYYATALDRFNMEIFSGQAVICFLDPGLFETVKLAGGFLTIEEVLGYIPDSAVDEYGIRLNDLPFGKFFPGVNELPADTVLCIRRISTVSFLRGQQKTEKAHQYHIMLFKDIVNFDFPEGYTADTGDTTDTAE